MKKPFYAIILASSILLCLGSGVSAAEPISPVSLRCEYRIHPLGIDEERPDLSWRLDSPVRMATQSAYHLLVASSRAKLDQNKGDLWDSGKVVSDQSVNVAYRGSALRSTQSCFWKVRVWDQDDRPSSWSQPATWSMGLMRPEDWKASWIRAPKVLPVLDDRDDNEKNELSTADFSDITKATYRTLDGRVAKDVTAIVRKGILPGLKSFIVHPDNLGGDPARRIVKELVVDYVKDGKPETVRANDFQALFGSAPSPQARGMQYKGKHYHDSPAPWLRKAVDIKGKPERAVIYLASRGYHELWVNGRKVGDHVLSPAVSVLKKRTWYVTYDITQYLQQGSNVIGVWLGRGWNAKGVPGVTDERPVVRLQGTVSAGGDTMQILSDPSWRCAPSSYTTIGPWAWDNYGGERYDAGRENPDWCTTEEDDSKWSSVEEVPPFPGVIDSQMAPLNRIGKRIPAVSRKPAGKGSYIYDFGTDLTGWVQLKMPVMPAGTAVSIIYRDSGKAPGNQFNQRDEFVSAGGANEVFVSKFNYRGFRTVEVSGIPSAPALTDATALLIESDLEPAGAFECSNDLINRIYQLNMWTIRSLNLGGYLVDCPHRERLGYGDGQVSVEGTIMNFWTPGFYEKWLHDWADTQGPTGEIPFSTPYHMPATGDTFGREGPIGWGGALPTIAWRTYLYHGNIRMLEKMYGPMRRFMERVESHTDDNILRTYGDKWQCLGDWVPPRRGMDTKNWPTKTANDLFNNCYRIYLLELMEKSALALGREDDASEYRAKIEQLRPLIHKAFYDPKKGIYVIDEQAYQVMPLMAGVVPQELRPAIMKKLENGILVKNKGHLDTGMLGTYFLLRYLSSIGRDDLLFTIVNQKTYPGWGNMVEQGATTMWEQWNGYWSRIHSCFTSPAGWFHYGLAGILPDSAAPGFKHFTIKPAIVGDPPSSDSGVAGLTWVKAHHISPYGRIVSHWKREGDQVTMKITVPPNTRATVHVPAKERAAVTESGKAADKAEGVKFLRMENGAALYQVGAGEYAFQSVMGEK